MSEQYELPNGTAKSKSTAPEYGAWQSSIYLAGAMHGIKPTVTTDPNKLEAEAKRAMSAVSYNYVAGGAGERATMIANRLAFRQWKIIPRMLRSSADRDLTVRIFGETYSSPVFCAPVGVQSVYHADGEIGVAEAAAEIDVPFVCSTASTASIEEVAIANDKGAEQRAGPGTRGRRWYQLYWPQTEAITESLLARAKAANYNVLIITLDTWTVAWRPWDLDEAFIPFFTGQGCRVGFTDPVFRKMFAKQCDGKTPEQDPSSAAHAWLEEGFSGKGHSWEDLAHVRKHWDGPILLKGIQCGEDAVRAWECGMDGIVCSNHGGRQLDGAVGSLEMLPEIVAAVKGKKSKHVSSRDFTVIFDSGIRTGVDIIKAMSLGAKAVLVGRPWVYGLGINGKKGAQDALRGILADFDQSMRLAGIPSSEHCSPDLLRRVQYGGDSTTNN